MSVNAGAAKVAVGAKVPKGRRPPTRVFSKTKWTLVVVAAAALLALVAFAALIAGSQAPSAGHDSSAASTNSLLAAEAVVPVSGPAAPKMSEQEALDAYGKLPLSFIPNEGQTDKAVRYYAQGAGYGFFFTKEGAMLSFAEGKGRGGHALGLDFLGANPQATLTAQERLSGKINYLVGDDPSKWQQDLPTHGELLYGGLWPGIDMAVRGEGGKLKYEFHLKAGSSVDDVRLAYRGAQGLRVGSGGDLLVQTPMGVLKDAAPVSYQRIGGERVKVKSRYVLKGNGGYGFAVGAYDPRYPLVIDPGLDYSTFLGGASNGQDIAVDGEGNAYLTGGAGSVFLTTPGAFDRISEGGDAFVTKLNASGSALAYSTFLGGKGGDIGLDIAVDGEGNAYVTGTTKGNTNSADDYPTTPGAFERTFDTTFNDTTDTFVTKLNASGSALAYSTFLGGAANDNASGIAVDGEGNAYVTGDTESTAFPTPESAFPTTEGAFDRTSDGADAFVTKLNASGSALAYSTILGGGEIEHGRDIAVDGAGSAYVTGSTVLFPPNAKCPTEPTESCDFPTTQGAFDDESDGFGETFVTKFNASGSDLDYSTFLGVGARDEGFGIAVDGEGSAYVTGFTNGGYHTTDDAFDTSPNGDRDAFVSKLSTSGSALVYSTFLGGSGLDRGRAIAVDGEGSSYVTGNTQSAALPGTPGAFPTTRGAFDRTYNGEGAFGDDVFVSKLSASGKALDNSTFLGGAGFEVGLGIAVDGEGSSYVTGGTQSANFPNTPGAFDTTFGGVQDAFVTKLLYEDFIPPTINVPTDITVDATGPEGAVVTYEATVTDDVDENPTLSCDPASGSTFPIGTTKVECTATDSSGNSANASFDVVVRGAAEQISNLKETVTNLGLRTSLNRSLQAKLDDALAHLNAGRTVSACSKLSDFNSQVSAQSGRQIDPGDAEILITDANRIKAVIGCR